jgi:hypothetical protein
VIFLISTSQIARITGLSHTWLLYYFRHKKVLEEAISWEAKGCYQVDNASRKQLEYTKHLVISVSKIVFHNWIL